MQAILLTLAFILEIVAFISFAAFGYVFPVDNWLKIVLFVLLFALLIVFWSLFMAPKAPKKFSPLPYYLAKTPIYAVSAITIFVTQGTSWGLTYVALAFVDELLLFKHNLAQK